MGFGVTRLTAEWAQSGSGHATNVIGVALQPYIAPEPAPPVPGSVDYRLKRRRLLADVESGVVSRAEACDAHPELLRAARNAAPPLGRNCPLCPEGELRIVGYVFGPGWAAAASASCPTRSSSASHGATGTSWPTRSRCAPTAAGTTSSGATPWVPVEPEPPVGRHRSDQRTAGGPGCSRSGSQGTFWHPVSCPVGSRSAPADAGSGAGDDEV